MGKYHILEKSNKFGIFLFYTLSRILTNYTRLRINELGRKFVMKQAARTTKQLGAIIRRERKRQGLTQSKLGEMVGLRQATISKLEAGEPATELQTLLDVLSALGLEICIDQRTKGRAAEILDLFDGT